MLVLLAKVERKEREMDNGRKGKVRKESLRKESSRQKANLRANDSRSSRDTVPIATGGDTRKQIAESVRKIRKEVAKEEQLELLTRQIHQKQRQLQARCSM